MLKIIKNSLHKKNVLKFFYRTTSIRDFPITIKIIARATPIYLIIIFLPPTVDDSKQAILVLSFREMILQAIVPLH
jgi:hypothetical protein